MGEFKGRKKEMSVLQRNYEKKGFQMAIVYGRRRIGKTMLINHFMDQQPCKSISFTAVERSESELVSMMSETVLMSLAPDMAGAIRFDSFDRIFEYIGRAASDERVIFLIDEYPYLAKQCPYIQSLLQKMIDHEWKASNLFFILCGSLVDFMKDEVLAESAPLHGRNNLELKLRPFQYLETGEFLDGYTLEEKAMVYGLTNGVAKYIRQFDCSKSLDENIVELFYDIGGYFSEELIKTVVTGERRNPALFNSVISAIATGHTKYGEIASFAGTEDVNYALKILINTEIIERKKSASKQYYALRDSMLEFWFQYVNKATSLIHAGNGERYYRSAVREHLHDFMGRIFEKMAGEYILANAGVGEFPVVTEVENYQNTVIDESGQKRQIELDVVGKNGKDIVLLAECKFKNTPFDKGELENFLEKIRYIPSHKGFLCLFSLSGFSDYVKEHAQGISLIGIEKMYAR